MLGIIWHVMDWYPPRGQGFQALTLLASNCFVLQKSKAWCLNATCNIHFWYIPHGLANIHHYSPPLWWIIIVKYIFIHRGGSIIFFRRGCTTKEWRNWLVTGRKHQAWVVQKVDNTIHWIKHYPADSVLYFVTLIRWIVIDPVDSVIQPSENRALMSNLKYYPKC